MYVDLDDIINSMHPDQKFNLLYKTPIEFFTENMYHLIDLHPRTMSPIAWDLKVCREKKLRYSSDTKELE